MYTTTIVPNTIHKLTLTQRQTTTNRILITAHNNDPVYFGIICDIDMYKPKQCTRPTTSIDETNNEIFNVIGAIVIDIYRRTQTEKTLFDHFFHCHFRYCVL